MEKLGIPGDVGAEVPESWRQRLQSLAAMPGNSHWAVSPVVDSGPCVPGSWSHPISATRARPGLLMCRRLDSRVGSTVSSSVPPRYCGQPGPGVETTQSQTPACPQLSWNGTEKQTPLSGLKIAAFLMGKRSLFSIDFKDYYSIFMRVLYIYLKLFKFYLTYIVYINSNEISLNFGGAKGNDKGTSLSEV